MQYKVTIKMLVKLYLVHKRRKDGWMARDNRQQGTGYTRLTSTHKIAKEREKEYTQNLNDNCNERRREREREKRKREIECILFARLSQEMQLLTISQ